MPLANKPSAMYFTHLMGSWQEKALLNTEQRFLTVLLTLLPRAHYGNRIQSLTPVFNHPEEAGR